MGTTDAIASKLTFSPAPRNSIMHALCVEKSNECNLPRQSRRKDVSFAERRCCWSGVPASMPKGCYFSATAVPCPHCRLGISFEKCNCLRTGPYVEKRTDSKANREVNSTSSRGSARNRRIRQHWTSDHLQCKEVENVPSAAHAAQIFSGPAGSNKI